MTLVENARQAWRWFSIQAMALAGAIQGMWVALPADMKATIPADTVQYVTLALVGAGIVGRLIQQDAAK